MNRREFLTRVGALATVGFVSACVPVAKKPDFTPQSKEMTSDEVKKYLIERKNAIVPHYYGWLMDAAGDMPLTLEQTMNAAVFLNSTREFDDIPGLEKIYQENRLSPNTLARALRTKDQIYFFSNTFKPLVPDINPTTRLLVDTEILHEFTHLLSKRVAVPEPFLAALDPNAKSKSVTNQFAKGFQVNGFINGELVSTLYGVEEAAATLLPSIYFGETQNSDAIRMPAPYPQLSAILYQDLTRAGILTKGSTKTVRNWHVNSKVVELVAAIGGPNPQKATDYAYVRYNRVLEAQP